MGKEIWSRGPNAECSDTPCLAVGVFNRGMGQESIPLSFASLGISGQIAARDLWAHKNLGQIKNGHVVLVPVHGAALLKLGK
jgi:alpha-galactosidase